MTKRLMRTIFFKSNDGRGACPVEHVRAIGTVKAGSTLCFLVMRLADLGEVCRASDVFPRAHEDAVLSRASNAIWYCSDEVSVDLQEVIQSVIDEANDEIFAQTDASR